MILYWAVFCSAYRLFYKTYWRLTMSNKVPFKSQAISRDLAVRIKNLAAGVAIEESVDADRFPTLKCSVGAKSVFVRISTDHERSEDDGSVDALGLAQRVYAPHKCELLQEEAATPPDASTLAMRAVVLAECAKLGMKLVIREGAGVEDAADWAAADVAADALPIVIRSSDIHPLTQQM